MKNNYILFITLLFLNMSITAFGQNGWTIYNSTNTILSSGIYSAVSIDQTGNIWAGGDYTGLFKFNGTTWTKFNSSNSNLLHDDINALVIDNSNKVWAGNYKGVSVFNGVTFTNYDTNNTVLNGMTIYAMGKDNNGKIWLSSKNSSFDYMGITTFDGSTWSNITGYPSQINGGEFTDFAFSATNEVWLACNNGFAKYNGTFTYYPPITTLPISQQVCIDASGNIWTGGFDALVKYNGSIWTKFDNLTNLGLKTNTYYYDILPDGNILWMATTYGLVKFDRTTSKVLEIYKSTNSPLADNGVKSIKKDANGNLWLATTIGIVKMDPAKVGLGMKEHKLLNPVSIYPNPAINRITIEKTENSNETSIRVINIHGMQVMQSQFQNQNKMELDICALVSGIYFIEVKTEAGIAVKKFVKE